MKKFLIISSILILLSSCQRIGLPENQKIYYKFTAEDYKYIPENTPI
ncbi:MAG: hypothetical protein KBA33_01450 [Cloacibacterium sp.]|nr:hypothetical protein [Cloacibacterium sp.]